MYVVAQGELQLESQRGQMRDASQDGYVMLAFKQSIDPSWFRTSAKACLKVSRALSFLLGVCTHQTPGLSARNRTTKFPCGFAMKVSLRIGVAGNSV